MKTKRAPRPDEEEQYVPGICWADAEFRMNLMERAHPTGVRIRRKRPEPHISPIVAVPARALILGADGKPLVMG